MALMKVRQGNKWCAINCLTLDSLKFTGNKELKAVTDNTNNNITYITFDGKKIAYKDDLTPLKNQIGTPTSDGVPASGIYERIEGLEAEKIIFNGQATGINSNNKYSDYGINSTNGELGINLNSNNKRIHAFVNFNDKKPVITYNTANIVKKGDDMESLTKAKICELDIYQYNNIFYVIWKNWS